MENREYFLSSKLSTKENNFNLRIPIQENHIGIFNKLSEKFRPASKLTKDIQDLVTGDLNLCRDKNIVIFYRGDNGRLNTLRFYLLMNFISNWKPYNEYISNLVNNDYTNYNSLSYDFISLEDISEMRFRNDNKEKINKVYEVDILFLLVQPTTRLFEDAFYKDIFRVTLSIRSNGNLVTVILFTGTENQYISSGFEEKTLGVSLKTYNLTGVTINKVAKQTTKKAIDYISEGDVF